MSLRSESRRRTNARIEDARGQSNKAPPKVVGFADDLGAGAGADEGSEGGGALAPGRRGADGSEDGARGVAEGDAGAALEEAEVAGQEPGGGQLLVLPDGAEGGGLAAPEPCGEGGPEYIGTGITETRR